MTANCEIYNWAELNSKEGIGARNDADLILKLIDNQNVCWQGSSAVKKIIDELDGVFAFAYWNKNKAVLCRDIFGVKPLWYSHTDTGTFAFASERKALEKMGFSGIKELNPREIIVYDIQS